MADVLSIGVKAGGKLYPAGTPLSDIPREDDDGNEVLSDEDVERISAYEVSAADQKSHAENFDREPGAALSTMRSDHNIALTEEHESGDYENGATSPDGGKGENPSVGNALTAETESLEQVAPAEDTEEPDSDPADPGDPDSDLAVNPDDYSRDDLVAMAEGKGLSVPSGATKPEIADLINGADEE